MHVYTGNGHCIGFDICQNHTLEALEIHYNALECQATYVYHTSELLYCHYCVDVTAISQDMICIVKSLKSITVYKKPYKWGMHQGL